MAYLGRVQKEGFVTVAQAAGLVGVQPDTIHQNIYRDNLDWAELAEGDAPTVKLVSMDSLRERYPDRFAEEVPVDE